MADSIETGAPKLVLLDGNALLYRGFFAMRALTASDGLPTNALFALTNMLLSLKERERPERMVCTWDAPVKTFRHLEFEGYKGTRSETPDDLRRQSPYARDLVSAFGVPAVEAPGFEADDLLGTLAAQGKKLGYDVLIVTGDLDALQLVEPGVKVLATIKGVTDTTVYDEAAVLERYGLTPLQLTDYRALKGDSSDNIPGVPGIGEKTAAKLLQDFGTIEELIGRIDEVNPVRIRESISAHIEQMKLSKRLATIVRDVPLEGVFALPAPGTAGAGEIDRDALKALLERLEFRQLLKRLDTLGTAGASPRRAPAAGAETADEDDAPTLPAVARTVRETAADYPDALAALVADARKAGTIALRCDTSDDAALLCSLRGVAVAIAPGDVRYVPVVGGASPTSPGADLGGLFVDEAAGVKPDDCDDRRVPEALAELLADETIGKITHDARTEISILARHGAALAGIVFDTELSAYLLLAGRRSGFALHDVAADMAQVQLPIPPDKKTRKTMTDDEAASLSRAASVMGADALFALKDALTPRLDAAELMPVLVDLELPVAPILAAMERVGVAVDTKALNVVSADMATKINELEGQIFEIAGGPFTIGSVKQLADVLFEKLKLPSGKKNKTGYSTDADTLEELAPLYPIVGLILSWRELSKLKSTYADAMPLLVHADGRIHTSLNQTVAATGRLSSSNPNLQNIPVRTAIGREIRRAFVAARGRTLLSCDYSQIELRIFAHVADDSELRGAFSAGEDIHVYTASKIYGVAVGDVTTDMRRAAKTVNYAVIYGISEFALARQLKISYAEAKELKTSYFGRFPGVRKWLDATIESAREKGFVQTLYGRRRYIPDINSRVFQFRQAAERAAANMPIQGSSADIMKRAMIDVDDVLRDESLPATLLLQVHDELLLEVEPDAVAIVGERVRSCMEDAAKLAVRLEVEVKTGHAWADVTPVGG